MKQFLLGQKVTWKSSSAGSQTTKTGKIVAVVPAGGRPRNTYNKLPPWTRKFDGEIPRDHDSYLVKVIPGKTGKASPVLYWPRVVFLEEVIDNGN